MKIEWLETAAIVAQYGSFSQAADMIPCSQSSVSRQIKSAEDELGFALFDRAPQGGKITLTENGSRIMPSIRRVLEEYSALAGRARQIVQYGKCKVKLGVERNCLGSKKSVELATQLCIDNPDMIVEIKPIFAKTPKMRTLMSKEVDAYVVVLAKRRDDERSCVEFASSIFGESARVRHVGSSEIYVCLSEKDPLAAREEIKLSELGDRLFLVGSEDAKRYAEGALQRSGLRAAFFEMCEEKEFEPKLCSIAHDIINAQPVIAAERSGCVFLSAFPKTIRGDSGIACVMLSDADYTAEYFLLSLASNRSIAISEVGDMLEKRFSMK